MSTKMMTAVWEHSKANGSALLLLLAIADNASDYGLAWPGIENLAQRARIGKRAVIKQLEKLEEMQELIIHRRPGTHNHYILNIQQPDESLDTALNTLAAKIKVPVEILRAELPALVNHSSPVSTTALVNQRSPGGEPAFTTTGEPGITRSVIRNVNEPSEDVVVVVDQDARARETEMNAVLQTALEAAGETTQSPPGPGEHLLGGGDAALAAVASAYENNIGAVTFIARQELIDLVDAYPEEWILDAIRSAVTHEHRHLAYIQGCLANWKRDGRSKSPPQKRTEPTAGAPPEMVAAICSAWGYDPATLTPKKRADVEAVASELAVAGASSARVGDFKGWLDAKAAREAWKSYTVKVMPTYWTDFAAVLAAEEARQRNHKPKPIPTLDDKMEKANYIRWLHANGRADEANKVTYDDIRQLKAAGAFPLSAQLS